MGVKCGLNQALRDSLSCFVVSDVRHAIRLCSSTSRTSIFQSTAAWKEK